MSGSTLKPNGWSSMCWLQPTRSSWKTRWVMGQGSFYLEERETLVVIFLLSGLAFLAQKGWLLLEVKMFQKVLDSHTGSWWAASGELIHSLVGPSFLSSSLLLARNVLGALRCKRQQSQYHEFKELIWVTSALYLLLRCLSNYLLLCKLSSVCFNSAPHFSVLSNCNSWEDVGLSSAFGSRGFQGLWCRQNGAGELGNHRPWGCGGVSEFSISLT